MENRSYIAAIDLGESTVVVIVGIKDRDGNIAIQAVASAPSEGVKAGQIENIALVGDSIKSAVAEVENKLGINILEAYAGISGEFVRCARHNDFVFVGDPQNGVSQADVNALFERMRNVHAPDGETIMERIPQNFIVDDEHEVRNPVGSFGRRLSSTFNFILCANTPMQRLEMALRRTGIRMIKSYSNALAVADAVLSYDEKNEGVAVVDIGGGVTDIAIYYHNVLRYIASIPIGSKSIDRDLRSMMIPEALVEKIKCTHGSAISELAPEGKAVRVLARTPRGESKDILLRNLATAIEARTSDIAEFVKQEVRDSGYNNKLTYGIVLTGGAANLKNIDMLFSRITGIESRIALPEERITAETRALVASAAYSTAVGLLIKGADMGPCVTSDKPKREGENPHIVERKVVLPPTNPENERSAAQRGKGQELPSRDGAAAQKPIPEPVKPLRPEPPKPEPKPEEVVVAPDESAEVDEPKKGSNKWGDFISKTVGKIYDKISSNDDVEI
ncbi:MAG: cell division protein FtsA [Rikenellaceae bacterium]